MPEIEDIIHRYLKFVYAFDELDKATYAFHLEEIIKRIKEVGFADIDSLWELKHIGINFISYIIDYKRVSKTEAVELLKREYVTYQNFIDIINYAIENWVKK